MTFSRRDFFKLTGAASAAAFMTRYPLLPRDTPLALAPGQPLIEVGLFRRKGYVYDELHEFRQSLGIGPGLVTREIALVNGSVAELKAIDYHRVRPDPIRFNEHNQAMIKATFATCVHRAWPTISHAGLYRNNRLVYLQRLDTPVTIIRGDTLQVNLLIGVEISNGLTNEGRDHIWLALGLKT